MTPAGDRRRAAARLTPSAIAALIWWATLGMIAIEGMVFALVIASYLYLKGRGRTGRLGPPPGAVVGHAQHGHPAGLAACRTRCAKKAAEEFDLRRCPVVDGGLHRVRARVQRRPRLRIPTLNVWWDTNAYGSIVWTLLGLHTTHVVTDLLDTLVLAVADVLRPDRREAVRRRVRERVLLVTSSCWPGCRSMPSSTLRRAWHDARRTAALWVGLLGGPVVWFTLLEANYVMSYVACESRQTWFLHLPDLVCAAVVAGAGLLAWRPDLAEDAEHPSTARSPARRREPRAMDGTRRRHPEPVVRRGDPRDGDSGCRDPVVCGPVIAVHATILGTPLDESLHRRTAAVRLGRLCRR